MMRSEGFGQGLECQAWGLFKGAGDTRETGGRRPLPEVGGSAEPPGVEGRDLLGGGGRGGSHAEVGTPPGLQRPSLGQHSLPCSSPQCMLGLRRTGCRSPCRSSGPQRPVCLPPGAV